MKPTTACLICIFCLGSVRGGDSPVARRNALEAVRTAVQQLQQHAGADQRVTAPASTVYPSKDFDKLYDGDGDIGAAGMWSIYRNRAETSSRRSYLNEVGTYLTPAERQDWESDLSDWWNDDGSGGTRNPHWVAVFDSSLRVDRATYPGSPMPLPRQSYEEDPNTIYGEFDRSQLPVWLVSGNERLGFDPRTDAGYPHGYLTPDVALPDPENGGTTVWLVGEGSATAAAESANGLDGRVKALKVDTDGGHYAYWIGDESLKANFRLGDPTTVNPATYPNDVPQSSPIYKNRLLAPQRSAWERMSDLIPFFAENPEFNVFSQSFQDIFATDQLQIFGDRNLQSGAVRGHFHDLTPHSVSLLTDTALGGLKKDLTRYLKDGDGLHDDDPIANPARYEVHDSRFAIRGGTNTGFPNSSPAALDGIPTFGQLRSWYQNAATGPGAGSINPDPESGAVPMLTYVHLQNGMSYDGDSKMIRMHWAPIIALWNPLDVALNTATYDIDLGILLHLRNFLVANEGMAAHSKLSERAALDPTAQWQEVTLMGPDFLGPGGKPVLEAVRDLNDVDEYGSAGVLVRNVTTPGTYEIFRVVFSRPHGRNSIHNPPPDGDTTNRYMVKMTGNPESYRLKSGPWVADDGSLKAKSDAFGRIYYATGPGQPSGMFHTRTWQGSFSLNSWGLLANGNRAFTTVSPHHSQSVGRYEAQPVDRPFPFRLSTNFGPGEVKIFTLRNAEEWTLSNRLALVNDYDPDYPEFFWTNVLEVVDGPNSSEAEDLRWQAVATTGSPAFNQFSPTVKMSVDGRTFFETAEFGAGGGWGMALGDDYNLLQGGNPNPSFVSRWRPLYDFANFEEHFQTQTAGLTKRSNWAFGDYYLAPFRMSPSIGDGGERSIHDFQPVFSRYNLGARNYELHPLMEQSRSRFGVIHRHPYVTGGDRLTNSSYQQGTGGQSSIWDQGQVDPSGGTMRGFALTGFRDSGEETLRGLSQLAIRNAKRSEADILSLGQLQQVHLSRYYWQPGFPIGSSDAPVYVDREGIAGIHSRIVGADRYSRSIAAGVRPNTARATPGNLPFPSSIVEEGFNAVPEDGAVNFWGGWNNATLFRRFELGGNTQLDLGYVLNENLWDRYFLSTLASPPTDLTAPLPNSRLRFNEHAPQAVDVLDFDLSSAYLNAKGSLNVNSTSVEAWKALFTAFRDLKLGSGTAQNPDNTAPVTRTLDPIAGSIQFDSQTRDTDDIGATATQKDLEKVFSGFRYLDDGMIQALSERIVDEVRLRGPFYSLSDFVNRRLASPAGSGDPSSDWYIARIHAQDSQYIAAGYDPFPGLQGLNGVLQRALNLSGINGGVNHPDLGDEGTLSGNDYDMVYTVRIRDVEDGYSETGIGGNANISLGGTASDAGFKYTFEPTRRSHFDTEHLAGSPAGEAGQLLQGAPGFVTQGDILAMIGSALTARGDTFLVRAYGDEVDGSGNVVATARVEAVVQRTIEPVTAAGPAGEDLYRPVSPEGRKFNIIGLRWLDDGDY